MRRGLLPAAAVLAWWAGGLAAGRAYAPAYPPPYEIRVPVQGAAGDMFSLALGARRLFADLWFVRLLQYYGSQEDVEEGEAEECTDHPGEIHHHHHHGINGEGRYQEFFARARHILELDPHFSAAGLYGAGSLAFNLNRPEQAQQLLDFAITHSPREWKYLTLLAAIGYSKAKEPMKVAEAIRPVLKDPDCPVMLKQLAAFLNKRAGNYAAAAAIYADIAATSRDAAYVSNARRELEKLSQRSSRK
jgi:tetratricopeptide (TPR) repeat protein